MSILPGARSKEEKKRSPQNAVKLLNSQVNRLNDFYLAG